MRRRSSGDIAGVGATELFRRPYRWVEKNYAPYAGKHNNNPECWARAYGWIWGMPVDIYGIRTVQES